LLDRIVESGLALGDGDDCYPTSLLGKLPACPQAPTGTIVALDARLQPRRRPRSPPGAARQPHVEGRSRCRNLDEPHGSPTGEPPSSSACSEMGGLPNCSASRRASRAAGRLQPKSPAPVTASRLIDLDAVLAKLVLLWDRSLADAWLTGSNPYLDGARPIDVLAMAGAADVLRAIDEEASGAYA